MYSSGSQPKSSQKYGVVTWKWVYVQDVGQMKFRPVTDAI